MSDRAHIAELRTHDVTNQPPALVDYNLFERDTPLREALAREDVAWGQPALQAMGAACGRAETLTWADLANRHTPELLTHDRFGHRLDEVVFHPAYHELMRLGIEHKVPSIAWSGDRPGGHTVHTVLEYLLFQTEAGVCCPLTMTYAAIAALRNQPEVAAEWEPRILAASYDPSFRPASEKSGVTIGMAMTEKQGGSDVRTNTTRAVPLGKGGPGEAYELTGHKWFCSAPMCDAFLTLAYAEGGLSCFLVPRWRPDGDRNPFLIQRLKDKLGNRSNASSEIEYDGTWAQLIGEEGRGVATIMDMVQHTRLDTTLAPAAMMRQAVVQATHHSCHRSAFQRRLVQQPLMQNVLADLALESEAATILTVRLARAFDDAGNDDTAGAFARIAVAVGKYWLNKRLPNLVYEAMECLGGAGYVEDSGMPRLYREAPLNSIWEGSGNVICLDVLRAIQRTPESLEVLLAEIGAARGGNRHLDAAIERLQRLLADPAEVAPQARRLTESLALCLQGSLLVRHAPDVVSEAFCRSRLGDAGGHAYGTLPSDVDHAAIIERAWAPAAA